MAWHSYHHAWIKEKQSQKKNSQAQDSTFYSHENLAKQLVLIAKGILKFGDLQRKTLGRWVFTYIRVGVEDVPWQHAHEAKAGEVACLVLGPLVLLRAGGVIAREVEVTEGGTRLGHHLLELLALTLVAGVILIVVVVLVGGSNFFLLRQSAMKWVVSLHSKQPLVDLLLSLWNLCNARNFLASRAISLSRMLSYYSSEAAHKEDKINSKADESVVLVGLASWFGWPFLDNSWDYNLLNSFSVSRVAKSVDSSKAVIFMPHMKSSRAYNNCLARALSE
jgi:hypothetical protein